MANVDVRALEIRAQMDLCLLFSINKQKFFGSLFNIFYDCFPDKHVRITLADLGWHAQHTPPPTGFFIKTSLKVQIRFESRWYAQNGAAVHGNHTCACAHAQAITGKFQKATNHAWVSCTTYHAHLFSANQITVFDSRS